MWFYKKKANNNNNSTEINLYKNCTGIDNKLKSLRQRYFKPFQQNASTQSPYETIPYL